MKKTAFLISAVLMLYGCTDPVQGLFYSIEKEEKTGDSSNALPNTVTVLGSAVRSPGTPQQEIYVAANSLYRTTLTSGWEKLSPSLPGLQSPAIYDVGALGQTLFVIAGNGGSRFLYKSSDGNTFTAVETGISSGTPEGLLAIEGDAATVLVLWNTGSTGYQAYAMDALSLKPLELLPSAASTPLMQALYTGTEYFALNKSLVYTGTGLGSSLTAEAVTTGGTSAGNLGGIVYTSVLNGTGTKEIVASTSRGTLVRRTAQPGNTWENYPGITALTNTNGSLELSVLTEWTTGTSPSPILLVGALGNGYAEAWYDGTLSTAVLKSAGVTVESVSFVNSTLGKKTVTGFQKYNDGLYAESPAGFWKLSGKTWNWE